MATSKQTYPTDLKYREWLLIAEFFPTCPRGRPRKWEPWQIVNAIWYVTHTGCQWRMAPKDLPTSGGNTPGLFGNRTGPSRA